MLDMVETSFNVVIVGGGLAGGLGALALSRMGLKVALIDAQDPGTMQGAAFDGRTTAIAYASARVFRRLGLWEKIGPYAEPILDILVTDGQGRGRGGGSLFHLHFDSRRLENGEPLGFIVENRVLRAALYAAIETDGRISLRAPAAVADVSFDVAEASVALRGGDHLVAPLILAADGRHSDLRRRAGIRASEWDYPQMAIVATIRHERPHKGVAHEYFLPSGPFAILPMTDHRSSLVWTERKDAASAYLKLDDGAFLNAITNRVGGFLGKLGLEGPRWSFPLALTQSERFVAPRIALIGDAARAIHPIAGQGFNLGVKDVAALADCLEEAFGLGLDIGSMSVLENYDRWRRFDSVSLAFGTDAINRLFSNDVAPLRLARDLGLGAVNAIGPLRTFFMRQAGGETGKLPALMRPR
jgi:2-octaprenyl-6-methoxyphenol hydroxylase